MKLSDKKKLVLSNQNTDKKRDGFVLGIAISIMAVVLIICTMLVALINSQNSFNNELIESCEFRIMCEEIDNGFKNLSMLDFEEYLFSLGGSKIEERRFLLKDKFEVFVNDEFNFLSLTDKNNEKVILEIKKQ